MKINILNTLSGLQLCSDSDFDAKKKLKIGQVYEVTFKLQRNYEFHKKYFALINCAWEFMREEQQEFFKTIESFRKTMEIAAGHCETIYSIDRKEWIQTPKSIAFDKMDNAEFQELYDRVLDVILRYPLKGIDRDYFEQNLINFL